MSSDLHPPTFCSGLSDSGLRVKTTAPKKRPSTRRLAQNVLRPDSAQDQFHSYADAHAVSSTARRAAVPCAIAPSATSHPIIACSRGFSGLGDLSTSIFCYLGIFSCQASDPPLLVLIEVKTLILVVKTPRNCERSITYLFFYHGKRVRYHSFICLGVNQSGSIKCEYLVI